MSRLRLGLLGCGRRGQAHASTIDALRDLFQLAAVCDPDKRRTGAIAGPRGAQAYSDVGECLSSSGLDAVIIATPPETHHLVAAEAAHRGIHMLIESPLALTRRMMDALQEEVGKAGVQAEVGEQMWRRPGAQLARNAIDAGLIGRTLRVSSYYESAGHDSCYHTMSLFRYFAGAEVEAVQAFAGRYSLSPDGSMPAAQGLLVGSEAEVWSQAVLFFENGVTGACTYVTNWISSLRRGHPRFMTIEGTEGFLVAGDAGQDVLRRVEGDKALTYPKRAETQLVGESEVPTRFYYDRSLDVEFINPFADRALPDSEPGGVCDGIARAEELCALHRSISEGAPTRYGIARARRDQELSIAITEAARLGRPLRLDELGPETAWEAQQHAVLSASALGG